MRCLIWNDRCIVSLSTFGDLESSGLFFFYVTADEATDGTGLQQPIDTGNTSGITKLWYPHSLGKTQRRHYFTPVFFEDVVSLWFNKPIHTDACLK